MPSDSEISVSVQNLWIRYRTTYEANPTLKGAVLKFGKRGERSKKSVRVVEAVKDVSFDVPNGKVLGIVGANGAGKSTLMRAVAGILPPTEGRITVNGRVSTLLALGVGFNAMLSGRENIMLGCLAAGLDMDEIQDKYDQITEFADLGDFIDLPMRTYSSGMYGRLAFAVSVHMDPDILLIDEALSAGDAAFKEKSFSKMRELCDQARTILIVSHALGTIQELCTDAIWMHKGELIRRGTPDEITEEYLRFLKVGESALTMEDV